MPVKHTIRADGFGAEETVTLGPAKAIQKFCRECYGFEVGWREMVKECRADEDNLMAYSRIRGAEVVLDALQGEIWEEKIERS